VTRIADAIDARIARQTALVRALRTAQAAAPASARPDYARRIAEAGAEVDRLYAAKRAAGRTAPPPPRPPRPPVDLSALLSGPGAPVVFPDPVLTVGQAARRLRCTAQHVRKLLRQGRLRGRKIGRDWLVAAAPSASRPLRKTSPTTICPACGAELHPSPGGQA